MVTRLQFISRAGALLLAGGAISSCSLLVDVNPLQCGSTPECQTLGPAFAGSRCERGVCVLAEPAVAGGGAGGAADEAEGDPLVCAAPAPNENETVVYSFAPIFLAGTEPEDPQPFSVKACAQFDFECERPLLGPVEVEAGRAHDFELPKGEAGFNGFFEITNPDTLSGLLFMGRPVVRDTIGWNVTMPSLDLVAQLAALTGEDVDPELGLILTVARDCEASPLEGVTIANSKGGLGYYFVMNVPDTALGKTGPQGAAGFANVPLLPTVVSGTHESGTPLGPVSVRVKPGFLSFAELFP